LGPVHVQEASAPEVFQKLMQDLLIDVLMLRVEVTRQRKEEVFHVRCWCKMIRATEFIGETGST
jgi:hypothetical protein